jgi:hypothetical protein
MSGLSFSSDAAEKLIAAYSTPDMARQRDATLQRLNLSLASVPSTLAAGRACCARAWLQQSAQQAV